MKFQITNTLNLGPQRLSYLVEECSFNTEPGVKEINFDLVINRVNLTVADDDNRIVQIWGVSGFKEWVKSNIQVPKSNKGILTLLDEPTMGVGSYRITKSDLPTYVNHLTGWICIGDPEKENNAVEFINDCIAVIDNNKELIAIWLKPFNWDKIVYQLF